MNKLKKFAKAFHTEEYDPEEQFRIINVDNEIRKLDYSLPKCNLHGKVFYRMDTKNGDMLCKDCQPLYKTDVVDLEDYCYQQLSNWYSLRNDSRVVGKMVREFTNQTWKYQGLYMKILHTMHNISPDPHLLSDQIEHEIVLD